MAVPPTTPGFLGQMPHLWSTPCWSVPDSRRDDVSPPEVRPVGGSWPSHMRCTCAVITSDGLEMRCDPPCGLLRPRAAFVLFCPRPSCLPSCHSEGLVSHNAGFQQPPRAQCPVPGPAAPSSELLGRQATCRTETWAPVLGAGTLPPPSPPLPKLTSLPPRPSPRETGTPCRWAKHQRPEPGNVPYCHRTDPLPSCLKDHVAPRGITWVQMSVAASIPV